MPEAEYTQMRGVTGNTPQLSMSAHSTQTETGRLLLFTLSANVVAVCSVLSVLLPRPLSLCHLLAGGLTVLCPALRGGDSSETLDKDDAALQTQVRQSVSTLLLTSLPPSLAGDVVLSTYRLGPVRSSMGGLLVAFCCVHTQGFAPLIAALDIADDTPSLGVVNDVSAGDAAEAGRRGQHRLQQMFGFLLTMPVDTVSLSLFNLSAKMVPLRLLTAVVAALTYIQPVTLAEGRGQRAEGEGKVKRKGKGKGKGKGKKALVEETGGIYSCPYVPATLVYLQTMQLRQPSLFDSLTSLLLRPASNALHSCLMAPPNKAFPSPLSLSPSLIVLYHLSGLTLSLSPSTRAAGSLLPDICPLIPLFAGLLSHPACLEGSLIADMVRQTLVRCLTVLDDGPGYGGERGAGGEKGGKVAMLAACMELCTSTSLDVVWSAPARVSVVSAWSRDRDGEAPTIPSAAPVYDTNTVCRVLVSALRQSSVVGVPLLLDVLEVAVGMMQGEDTPAAVVGGMFSLLHSLAADRAFGSVDTHHLPGIYRSVSGVLSLLSTTVDREGGYSDTSAAALSSCIAVYNMSALASLSLSEGESGAPAFGVYILPILSALDGLRQRAVTSGADKIADQIQQVILSSLEGRDALLERQRQGKDTKGTRAPVDVEQLSLVALSPNASVASRLSAMSQLSSVPHIHRSAAAETLLVAIASITETPIGESDSDSGPEVDDVLVTATAGALSDLIGHSSNTSEGGDAEGTDPGCTGPLLQMLGGALSLACSPLSPTATGVPTATVAVLCEVYALTARALGVTAGNHGTHLLSPLLAPLTTPHTPLPVLVLCLSACSDVLRCLSPASLPLCHVSHLLRRSLGVGGVVGMLRSQEAQAVSAGCVLVHALAEFHGDYLVRDVLGCEESGSDALPSESGLIPSSHATLLVSALQGALFSAERDSVQHQQLGVTLAALSSLLPLGTGGDGTPSVVVPDASTASSFPTLPMASLLYPSGMQSLVFDTHKEEASREVVHKARQGSAIANKPLIEVVSSSDTPMDTE
ncbi:hypothetical protein KIPB_004149 [Kipferlia bialata]|uniref:Uncharacterized protein n=1 Tax=Kipferlia bialata TaxID=797122 RepID=A0A9K3CU16_9EUKA|nr:hypothetical protein KIPB_004149 [Kipferlia bialata]|eukprot:g4149.t1